MLDFYTISEGQNIPESPEVLNLSNVGNLDLKTFTNLQNKGIISREFNYYEDFRWNASYVESKLAELSNSSDTDANKLKEILVTASSKSLGLVAFID